jgi:fumarate reductase subunit C
MNPRHTLHHPRWHRERTPIFWWLGSLSYTKFIARELTSLAVVYSAALLLAEAWALARGEEAHRRLGALLRSPWAVAFHLAVLAALVFHAVTWLNLAPRALALRMGGRPVPEGAVLAAHYAAWAAASALVAWGLLGGP